MGRLGGGRGKGESLTTPKTLAISRKKKLQQSANSSVLFGSDRNKDLVSAVLWWGSRGKGGRKKERLTVPVVIVAMWRINREVVHGQSAVRGEVAPILHVISSYRQRTC
jgi:hypothetical protein